VPEQAPVPPFSRRLPPDVADRVRSTAASRPRPRKVIHPVVVEGAFGRPSTVENDSC
jgi:hypothetical protein